MRPFFLKVHRWLGLASALFLLLTGLTGALISWDHELDEWLNPAWMHSSATGAHLPSLALAQQVAHRYPQAQVTSIPLAVEAGHTLSIGVKSQVDPSSGQLYDLGFNQVFMDPVTGQELGKREWGAVWPLDRTNFVSFLYKLHYSLHLPEMWGIDRWGIWLMGIVAIIWLIDSFVGVYLTLPKSAKVARRKPGVSATMSHTSFGKRWLPAWKIRWNSSEHKRYFDLHRAFGLWTWLLLIILAFSAFALNLRREVFMPLMQSAFTLTPTPFDLRKPLPKLEQVPPNVGFEQVLALAIRDARANGWHEPAGRISYSLPYQLFSVDFYSPDADHGVAGAGHKRLYYDAIDARPLGQRIPWQGTAGDLILQAQFPLHSGRILGLPGRILISVMGVVVAMLSVTGVYLWWKKRKARKVSVMIAQGSTQLHAYRPDRVDVF
ncbi:PepSY-associated TM helix domain-containing protein [Methylophilus aquaticus]|uniref:PepSY-associated TM helix domain-containing protein n=1 Tax=Methylophilus aquaticus TaxID=1971610 RepID=A0ABT9JRF8_9PROT|nr:PepSY-associated TM helix domain-containing protein [Methylophilus aquaticus]MDP8566695.1 PepSY-associated TM helix domain-containing protein [Methylophilus aquaticus]